MGKLFAIVLICVCLYLGWKGVTSFGVTNDSKNGVATIQIDKAKASEVFSETKATTVKTYNVSKNIATKSGKVISAVYTAVKE